MHNHKSQWVTLLRALAVIALGFSCWLAGLLGLWWLLGIAGIRADPWAMTQTLSSALAAAAVLGGGIIAYRAWRELARGRHVQVADKLFDELNSPESIDAGVGCSIIFQMILWWAAAC